MHAPPAPCGYRLGASCLLLSVVLVSVAANQPCRAQPTKSYAELIRKSGFIFQGTVKAVGAATPTVVREPNTAIVVVNSVLEALPPLGNPTGREVTVRLLEPGKIKPGQTATFFTYVYSAGTSLGLQEVGMLPLEDAKEAANRVRIARAFLNDEALAKRLASAELVVIGVVGEASPTEGAREHKGEHDPLWWRAPIEIESTLKGKPKKAPVFVNIARSDDYVWERAPKPKPGDSGIFLLQPDAGKRFDVPGLFLVDPLDALDRSELDRVRRLLGSKR